MPRNAKQEIAALLVNRVDLVTQGDNPEAKVALWKSRDQATSKKCKQCGQEMGETETICPSCGLDQSTATETPKKGATTMTKSSVYAEIQEAAAAIDAPTLDQKVARLLESEAGAELKAKYDEAEFDVPVAKQDEVELTPVEKASAEVAAIAKTKGKGSTEYAAAMAKRYELLGHYDEAAKWKVFAGA